MKRINESSKVTLTLKQLKRLVKEAKVNEGPGAGYTVEMKDITLLNATATVADGAWKVKGDCRFIGHAEGYDWSTEELEYEGEFEFHVNTHQINKYVEKYLPEWDPEDVTEEDIKEMLERTDAYSIEDISQMIGAGWIHVKWNGVLEVDQAGFDLDDRYLNGHNAEVGDFDIELYDKGAAPEGDCNNCYFSIVAHDDFALDVETAYEMKDEEGEPLDEETDEGVSVKESSPYDDEFEESLSHLRTDYDIAEWMMDNVDFDEFGCSKSLLFSDGRSGRNYAYWVGNLEKFLADHGIVGKDFEHIIDQLEYFWSVDNVEGYDDMENLIPPRNVTLKK